MQYLESVALARHRLNSFQVFAQGDKARNHKLENFSSVIVKPSFIFSMSLNGIKFFRLNFLIECQLILMHKTCAKKIGEGEAFSKEGAVFNFWKG